MSRRGGRWTAGLLALALFACGGDEGATAGGDAPMAPPQALPRIGVVFGEPQPGFEPLLHAEARRRGRELDVRSGYGSATATEAAVLALVDRKVEAILLFPSAPDLLQRARRLAADREVPLLLALRGDGRSGAWVGAPSSELAGEAGTRVAARLAADGVKEPRVVVIEDARWPESRRRAELTLDALEQRFGKIEVRLRHPLEATVEQTLASLLPLLARLQTADLLVGGDPASTAVAVEAAQRAGLAASACVAGISDDPALHEAAKAAGARLALVTYTREEAAPAFFAAIEALRTTPLEQRDALRAPLACTLIGLGAEPPAKAGS
ncbi:MAG: sugar ABC transporter substrate-binding protein [Planctomycetes bacterium]|nr:sugar ABC transporter substrate-binding protein [Planctomycetota bacterium]